MKWLCKKPGIPASLKALLITLSFLPIKLSAKRGDFSINHVEILSLKFANRELILIELLESNKVKTSSNVSRLSLFFYPIKKSITIISAKPTSKAYVAPRSPP